MTRARCLALAGLLSLGTVAAGQAAPGPGWVKGLARALSAAAASAPTNLDLPELFGPFLVFAPAPCATMRLPVSGAPPAAPVASAIVGYDDDTACDKPTRLQLLQVGIRASPGDGTRLRAELDRRLAGACFAGALPGDPRRRAPPRFLAAWRTGGRVITFALDEGLPGTVVLSLVILPPAGAPPGDGLRDQVIGGLPAPCR